MQFKKCTSHTQTDTDLYWSGIWWLATDATDWREWTLNTRPGYVLVVQFASFATHATYIYLTLCRSVCVCTVGERDGDHQNTRCHWNAPRIKHTHTHIHICTPHTQTIMLNRMRLTWLDFRTFRTTIYACVPFDHTAQHTHSGSMQRIIQRILQFSIKKKKWLSLLPLLLFLRLVRPGLSTATRSLVALERACMQCMLWFTSYFHVHRLD